MVAEGAGVIAAAVAAAVAAPVHAVVAAFIGTAAAVAGVFQLWFRFRDPAWRPPLARDVISRIAWYGSAVGVAIVISALVASYGA